jgi:hypothetical protein
MTALPNGRKPHEVCLIAPAGERRRFIDRHAPADGFYEASVDFTPKTYGDLIQSHDLHPERKFAGPDGLPCRSVTVGLLGDLPIVAAHIKHVGKEGNELEEHDAGVIEESERQLEYHDSAFDDMVRALREIPTTVIAEATGYNQRTVRRLKRRPSAKRLSALLVVAGPCTSTLSGE